MTRGAQEHLPLMMRTNALALLVLSFTAACSAARTNAPAVSPNAPMAAIDPAASCLAGAMAKRERGLHEPSRISVRHVLVKHSSSKSDKAASEDRTREQACVRAIAARDRVIAGADFVDVVSAMSDEAGASSRGGLIADIERSDVVPAFADAAFELEVGQMSDVVETPFGFHVILRTR